jgi:hypothetical protein
MELSPSWEAKSCSATKEFPNILWNLRVHYCVHNGLPLVPILSQMNTVPAHLPISLRSILVLSSHLHIGLLNGLFISGSPTKPQHVLLSHVCYMSCPSHQHACKTYSFKSEYNLQQSHMNVRMTRHISVSWIHVKRLWFHGKKSLCFIVVVNQ